MTRSDDAVVSLSLGAARDAMAEEDAFELGLVGNVAHAADGGMVCVCANCVGFCNHSDLMVVLDDAAALDGLLEQHEIFVVKLEQGNVGRDLTGDNEYGG